MCHLGGMDVVIIGGGEAGARVAHELHTAGWEGTVTLVGEEYRPVYERPPLSKNVLLDEIPEAVEPYRGGRLDVPGLTLRPGERAEAIDVGARSVRLAGGEDLRFDRLVLATGARARTVPGLPGNVPVLRTWDEALALRSALTGGGHLLVIGAGMIGMEVAASARTRGLQVSVVEVADRAMGRAVPAPVAAEMVARHEAEGVSLRLSTTVASLTRESGQWRARLEDGEELLVDHVLACVGTAPDTDLARTAGIEVDDGVVVDQQMRTSAPGVWAVGDCVSGPVAVLGRRQRLESWRMAHDQAVTAAASIRGEEPEHAAVPWFWSDQYDLSLQVSGMAVAARTWLERPEPDGSTLHLGLDDAGRVVCAAGVGRAAIAKDVRAAERIISSGAVLDPAELVDPTVRLKALARR